MGWDRCKVIGRHGELELMEIAVEPMTSLSMASDKPNENRVEAGSEARGSDLESCVCVRNEGNEGIELLMKTLLAGCILADWLIYRLRNIATHRPFVSATGRQFTPIIRVGTTAI